MNRYLAETGDRRPVAAAAVPLLPGGGPSQNECDGRAAAERWRRSEQSSAVERPRVPGAGRRAAASSAGRHSSRSAGSRVPGSPRWRWSLAPHVGAVPGAVVLRSDEIRKRLAGVSPLDRLDAQGYSPDSPANAFTRTLAERRGADRPEPATASSSMRSMRAPPIGRPSSARRRAPRSRSWGCGSTRPNPRSSPVPNGAGTTPRTPMRRSSGRNCSRDRQDRLAPASMRPAAAPAVAERVTAYLQLHAAP